MCACDAAVRSWGPVQGGPAGRGQGTAILSSEFGGNQLNSYTTCTHYFDKNNQNRPLETRSETRPHALSPPHQLVLCSVPRFPDLWAGVAAETRGGPYLGAVPTALRTLMCRASDPEGHILDNRTKPENSGASGEHAQAFPGAGAGG